MFIGKYDKSVIVTYLGTLSSMIGIYFVLGGEIPRITGAIICLMIAGICDLFDGTIARRCKRTEEEKMFGVELDSLIDVVNFLAFPIIILPPIGFPMVFSSKIWNDEINCSFLNILYSSALIILFLLPNSKK